MRHTVVGDWRVALRAGSLLAAAVGVGRFVFTPILPLMQSQADVTAQLGGALATANYAGYLVGAIATIAFPRLAGSGLIVRTSAVCVVVSLALMALVSTPIAWVVLRGVAGVGGAVMFVAAAGAVLNTVSAQSRRLVGWAYGGVGAGIALSGASVLAVGVIGDWRMAWCTAAMLAAGMTMLGWNLIHPIRREAIGQISEKRIHQPHRWFVPLVVAYFLEGVGYIIVGTFLVAAVAETTPGSLSNATWIIVGCAAVPSCVLWAWLSTRISHPTLLTVALGLQAGGIVLAALDLGTAGAIAAAVLFGGTFMGVTTLALGAGRLLQVSAAVAILSAVYAFGQVIGPVVVVPLLTNGYITALFIAAGVVTLAAIMTAFMRVRFPHTLDTASPKTATTEDCVLQHRKRSYT